MKYIFALVALFNVVSSIKIGNFTGALVEIKNATQALAKVNITTNETLKKIVNEAQLLNTLVQSGEQNGVKYTDDEVKAIVGLYDGLYGMWYPYYHPTQHPDYNPDTPPFLYHYPYYNPWTPAYVNSIDALRSRVTAEAVLDSFKGPNGVVNQIYGKILEGHSEALVAGYLAVKK